MLTTPPRKLFTTETWVFLCFVTFLGFLTFFYRYQEPARVFWDENYHIASAQKYLNGVFFMEQHPPLGKLLIALGEKIFHPNARTDEYITTDYASKLPDTFSFVGYRFFSALLGWWTVPLFFLILLLITRNGLFAALLSFFYIFDNALIVHMRGAMLEGPLMFFSALVILSFFLLLEYHKDRRSLTLLSLLFGASFGLALTTKLFALILILLLPALLFTFLHDWKKIMKCTGLFLAGFAAVYLSVWYIHFALGSRIVPELPDDGYYQASEQYKTILNEGTNGSILNFPVMLRDSLAFVSHYNNGAPRLDLCKNDENGSPPFLWPLGARSINYRWETPDGKQYQYLYLQSNPVVWLTALLGLIVAISLLLSSVFIRPAEPLQNRYLLSVFVFLWISYIIVTSRIERVLYLYHYFIPLFLTFIIFAMVFVEIRHFWKWRVSLHARSIFLLVLAGLIFVSFQFYRPLTYYEPLTDEQFRLRAILPVWELSCVHCNRINALAVPRSK